MKNVRSSQPCILMNFCTEFSKAHKFFHVTSLNKDLNVLKIIFHILIVVLVDKSVQSVDAVNFQLNYAVGGCLTNDYRKREPLEGPFRLVCNMMETTLLLPRNKYFPAGVFGLHQFMKNINKSSEQHHITLPNMQNKWL